MLGRNGIELWKRANGQDATPVQPYREQKSMSAEHTFEQDTIDVAAIRRRLAGMVERLAFDLRRQGRLTGCVTVKLRYANFDTHDKQQRIPYTAFDHVLQQAVEGLFDRLYDRRMMIRLVGVRFSELVGGQPQLDLFENQGELLQLYAALDHIKTRFGAGAITHGNTLS